MIYIVHGRGQPVGPFKNREYVNRFIKMMALCGENWADSKIVEGGIEDVPEKNTAQSNSCADQFENTNNLKLVGKGP